MQAKKGSVVFSPLQIPNPNIRKAERKSSSYAFLQAISSHGKWVCESFNGGNIKPPECNGFRKATMRNDEKVFVFGELMEGAKRIKRERE